MNSGYGMKFPDFPETRSSCNWVNSRSAGMIGSVAPQPAVDILSRKCIKDTGSLTNEACVCELVLFAL